MARGPVLQIIAQYFADKGQGYMTYADYKAQTDKPVSAAVLKRAAGGSWTRVKARIEKYFPDIAAKINNPVVEEEAEETEDEKEARLRALLEDE
jgi:hypothetical protein